MLFENTLKMVLGRIAQVCGDFRNGFCVISLIKQNALVRDELGRPLLHYSDNYRNIIPITLILFRKSGILPLEGSDYYVYDRKASRRKMGAV